LICVRRSAALILTSSEKLEKEYIFAMRERRKDLAAECIQALLQEGPLEIQNMYHEVFGSHCLDF